MRKFRKRSRFVLSAFLLLSIAGSASADLIGYYPFDEDASDISGFGNHGTPEGDAIPSGPFTGIDGIGGAFQFAGQGHVVVPIDANPGVYPGMTVTMWVKPDESIVDTPGLHKTFGHDDGGWDRTFGLDTREGDYRYAAFTGGARPGPTAATTTPVSEDWTFLAGVWDADANEVRFHANEAFVTDNLNNTTSIHTASAIGNLRPDNFSEGWIGLIDDVRIFDEALSIGEVDDIRLTGAGTEVTLTAVLTEHQETHNTVNVPAAAGGAATFNLDISTGALDWDIDFADLSGNVSGMHLHGPAGIGENAGVEINVGNIGGTTSPSSGSATLTEAQSEALLAGDWYLNLHTAANGSGEIRGQVRRERIAEWNGLANGSWNDTAGWTSVPSAGSSILVSGAASVAGPAVDTRVRSLSLNSNDTSFAELRLRPGVITTVDELINVGEKGRLVGAGTLGGVLNIQSGGELVVLGGDSFEVTDRPRPIAGTVNSLGNLSFTKNVISASSGQINAADGTLSFPGNGTKDDVGLVNNGTLNLTNLTVNGDVHSPSGSTINVGSAVEFQGLVSGAADFPGTGLVTFNGGFDPGDSPASVSLAGDVVFGNTNTLRIEIGGLEMGDQYDTVNVAGEATLDGMLEVTLIDDFQPAVGDTFTFMTFADRNDTQFESVMLPTDDWQLSYGDNQLMLTHVPEPSAFALALGLPMLYFFRRRNSMSNATRSALMLGLFFVLSVGSMANTSQADLIAHFPFDEDFSNQGGAGEDGMAEGDAVLSGPFTGRDGQGGAASFSGAGHVVVPVDINPNIYPELTVTMWVKPDASIVNSPGLFKTFGHDDGGWDRTFGIDNREGEYRYAAFTGGAGPGPTAATGTEITADWTFLAAVWDNPNGEVTFYAGENSVTQSLTETFSAHQSFAIGNLRPDNFAEGWRGLIDDVFVFDEVLDADSLESFRQPVGTISITAELHQDQEVDAVTGVSPSAEGFASFELDQGTNLLNWSVDWSDATGPATGLHIHGPASVGSNGGVVINLGDNGGLDSPSSGTLSLSSEQADLMRNGDYYVNLHTATNPGGELRGQLLPLKPASFGNPDGGSWDNVANWPTGELPDQNTSVSVSTGTFVSGPNDSTGVRKLTLGATDGGVAELRMAGGHDFVALEGVEINAGGRLIADGSISGPLELNEGGELAVMTNELLSVVGTPKPNSGRISVFGDLTFEKNLVNTSTGRIHVVNGRLTVPSLTDGNLQLTNAAIVGDVHSSTPIDVTGTATFDGLVSGDANFPGAGTPTFKETYSPGDGTAVIDFGGDVVFDGTLFMEIGGLTPGTSYDQLNVAGSATWDGDMKVELIDGFIPADGNQFVLMTYDSMSGPFDNVMLPLGDWTLDYGATQLTLRFGEGGNLLGDFNMDGMFDTMDLDSLVQQIIDGIDSDTFDMNSDGSVDADDIANWLSVGATQNGFAEPFLPGDADLDGDVDAVDLNALGVSWQESPNTWARGDFNADGKVDALDLNSLGVNWQKTIANGAQAVPEPNGAMMAVCAVLALFGLRRRRRCA